METTTVYGGPVGIREKANGNYYSILGEAHDMRQMNYS